MTIKHLLYMQLCAFMYTKGAYVGFFRFRNSPMKIFYDIQSVASISDQREYKYSTYQISWIHVVENNIKRMYQLMRRHET